VLRAFASVVAHASSGTAQKRNAQVVVRIFRIVGVENKKLHFI
jgi:hypothetical protein